MFAFIGPPIIWFSFHLLLSFVRLKNRSLQNEDAGSPRFAYKQDHNHDQCPHPSLFILAGNALGNLEPLVPQLPTPNLLWESLRIFISASLEMPFLTSGSSKFLSNDPWSARQLGVLGRYGVAKKEEEVE